MNTVHTPPLCSFLVSLDHFTNASALAQETRAAEVPFPYTFLPPWQRTTSSVKLEGNEQPAMHATKYVAKVEAELPEVIFGRWTRTSFHLPARESQMCFTARRTVTTPDSLQSLPQAMPRASPPRSFPRLCQCRRPRKKLWRSFSWCRKSEFRSPSLKKSVTFLSHR